VLDCSHLLTLARIRSQELQRRGVSRDDLLSCLKRIGASEFPAPTLSLLHALKQHGMESRILSDCNTVSACLGGSSSRP